MVIDSGWWVGVVCIGLIWVFACAVGLAVGWYNIDFLVGVWVGCLWGWCLAKVWVVLDVGGLWTLSVDGWYCCLLSLCYCGGLVFGRLGMLSVGGVIQVLVGLVLGFRWFGAFRVLFWVLALWLVLDVGWF